MSTPSGYFGNSSPVTADSTFAVNSKIMIVAVVVLFGVVMFILGLHLYAKWFWRQGAHSTRHSIGWRRRRRLEFASEWPGNQTTSQVGLEKAILDQLPIFIYQKEKDPVNGGALECAVCLEEFGEGEKGRLLPKCSHNFHIECIDMWFLSHSTCPLCRCNVVPENSPASQEEPSQINAEPPAQSGAIIVNISDVSGGNSEMATAPSVLTLSESGREFLSPVDSVTGTGVGLLSPRQQQEPVPVSGTTSPSIRSQGVVELTPKPSGIPTNVLFWGNQTQMNLAGTVSGGSCEETVSPRNVPSIGVRAPTMLVIEIPRTQVPTQHQGSDEPSRVSESQGDRPRSPLAMGRFSSSFRRLLSIRRTTTNSSPEDTCSSLELDQKQQQQAAESTSFQV